MSTIRRILAILTALAFTFGGLLTSAAIAAAQVPPPDQATLPATNTAGASTPVSLPSHASAWPLLIGALIAAIAILILIANARRNGKLHLHHQHA